MPRLVLLDCKLVTWQLLYLFAPHASAINNFATLLLRYTAPITRISRALQKLPQTTPEISLVSALILSLGDITSHKSI